MNQPIQVSFTFNDTTYHGAYKEHLKHRQKIWIWIRSVLCVLMISLGAYLMILRSNGEAIGVNSAFGPIFITAGSVGFLRPMIWQMWHERNVRKNPAYGTKLNYTFSQEGVSVRGSQGKFDLSWADLHEMVITKKGVLVYQSKKGYLWVPRKAFTDDEWSGIQVYSS